MLDRFESLLDELLHPSKFPEGVLAGAARYATIGSGKRIRPRLLMATSVLSGQPLDPSLIPACALEMIHTYSLIHDDLPCMDNDDIRRGKPSLHKVFTEGQALLTGNFLLTYAFELLANAPYLTDSQRLQLIQIVSKRCGAWGMIGGQELDIRWDPKMATEASLKDLHRRKTGALIQASVECGIVIGEPKSAARLNHLAALLGELFQLLDDLQDRHDLAYGRPTALAIWSIEKAEQEARALYSQIQSLILPWKHSELEQVISDWQPHKLQL